MAWRASGNDARLRAAAVARHRRATNWRTALKRILGLALLGILALALLWLLWISAQILWYRTHPPRETAFMAQRMEEARARNPNAQLRYQWVPYNRISPHLKRALIAAEDAKFSEHSGFDWDGIRKALEKNRSKGRVVSGGSTITQQLA